MTGAERQALRHAINQKVREHRTILIRDGEVIVCSGCGADSDCRTTGCKVCTERHLKRKLRRDEERRREAEARARRHHRRRQVAAA